MSTAEPNLTESAVDFVTRVYEATDADINVEGRTVDVRLVPFGEVARVADPPSWEPYEEEWLPGCFDHQFKAANRVVANYKHNQSIQDAVGHGTELRREPDGYHLSVKILPTPAGDTTLELIKGGALPGVSLEARPVQNTRTSAGVIQRVKAHLKGMAFCQEGAFAGAQVLAVRTPPAVTIAEELIPKPIDPELVQRLRAKGFRLPDRYNEAHPDTGTPDGSGTPDQAPADDEKAPTSSED